MFYVAKGDIIIHLNEQRTWQGRGEMRVILLPKGEAKEFPGRHRVVDILKALDIIPETVLVANGNTLLTIDETVEAEAVLRIIPVISGGARQ